MNAINHVGIVVNNLAESILFYENVLGLKVIYRGEVPEKGLQLAFLATKGLCFELLEFVEKPPRDVPLNHVAITVEDIDAWTEHLKQAQASLLDTSPRTVLEGRSRILFLTGPNGERIELHQPIIPLSE